MINQKVKLISIDAMNTLIRLRENPGIVYARFAQNLGINVEPPVILSNFKTAFKEVDSNWPCYAVNNGCAIIWWSAVVRRCFMQVSFFILVLI